MFSLLVFIPEKGCFLFKSLYAAQCPKLHTKLYYYCCYEFLTGWQYFPDTRFSPNNNCRVLSKFSLAKQDVLKP